MFNIHIDEKAVDTPAIILVNKPQRATRYADNDRMCGQRVKCSCHSCVIVRLVVGVKVESDPIILLNTSNLRTLERQFHSIGGAN